MKAGEDYGTVVMETCVGDKAEVLTVTESRLENMREVSGPNNFEAAAGRSMKGSSTNTSDESDNNSENERN